MDSYQTKRLEASGRQQAALLPFTQGCGEKVKLPMIEFNFDRKSIIGSYQKMTQKIIGPDNTDSLLDRITSSFTGLSRIADKARDTEIKSATNEAQTQLASALNMIVSLHQRIGAIESEKHRLSEELRELKHKQTEKNEYQLQQLISGSVIYVFKNKTVGGKPAHAICANCFEHGIKSYLQIKKRLEWELFTRITSHANVDLTKKLAIMVSQYFRKMCNV